MAPFMYVSVITYIFSFNSNSYLYDALDAPTLTEVKNNFFFS